jgi:cytochrome b561
VSVGGAAARVYSAANDISRGLHELLGMSVFALILARVSWRAKVPTWMELGATPIFAAGSAMC